MNFGPGESVADRILGGAGFVDCCRAGRSPGGGVKAWVGGVLDPGRR